MVILLLACSSPPTLPPGDPARPDVILVSIDSLRPDHLGAYGNTRTPSPSPFLDSLAAAGTRYTEARSSSPWTLPSHVTMLSGRGPLEHGVVEDDRHIPDDLPMVQEAMRAGGFATGGFVSTVYVSDTYGFARGFDHFDDHDIQVKQNLQHPVRAEKVVDEAVKWASGQGAKPVFLFVHLYDVHYPYLPPEPWAFRYDKAASKKAMKYRSYDWYFLHPVEAERWPRLLAQYDESIAYVDDQLQRLKAAWGDRKATWVVTADHGEELGERGSWGHAHTLYPEAMRVPLIVSGAGVATPAVRDDRVGVLDVAATVAKLGGVDFPNRGVDVLGAVPPARDQVFDTSRFDSARLGILHGDLRLDVDLAHDKVTLYDDAHDPGETNPIPGGVDPALVEQLWAAVGAHWTSTGAVMSTGWMRQSGGEALHRQELPATFALFPPDAKVDGPATRDAALPEVVELGEATKAQLEALGYEQ